MSGDRRELYRNWWITRESVIEKGSLYIFVSLKDTFPICDSSYIWCILNKVYFLFIDALSHKLQTDIKTYRD